MKYIDMNKPVVYQSASLRFFKDKETHVSRTSPANVLLLVFEGVLRFNEDGIDYEIGAGEYFIQREGGIQLGKTVSDSPKYLYVHFFAEWKDDELSGVLKRGVFDYETLAPLIDKMNKVAKGEYTYIEKLSSFLAILSELYKKSRKTTVAETLRSYIARNFNKDITLKTLAELVHFSQNHVIKLFKKSYKQTPFEYLNFIRLKEAAQLLENTDETIENISYACGYKSYVHFYKSFIKNYAMSPLKWRNSNKFK